MRHVVSVGGGFSSTIELPLEVIRKHGAENVDLVICALAGESDDLWRLVRECERLTGKHVTRVSYAPDDDRKFAVDARFETWWGIWDVFFDQGMMGNPFADPCSRMLKRETMARYMTATYDPANTVLHVGITKNEIDRMLAIRRNWSRQGWTVEADLCDVELVGNSGERCQQMLGWQPIAYMRGHTHNNCNGFCIKAGKGQMARLLYFDRENYLYHEINEAKFQERFNTTATIMRDEYSVKGVRGVRPLSLRQFRERMEAKWAAMLPGFDPFDALDDTPMCRFCEAV